MSLMASFPLQSTCPVTYLDRIDQIKAKLDAMGSPARLDLPFTEGRPPTQAFSEFLTNKEQGDWAEKTFIENFNQQQTQWWAVKYGRSEDLVAGEPGFDEYYRRYQEELREIGKRPDVLVFQRPAFLAEFGQIADISTLPRERLDLWVARAIWAIEVRSSAFLSKKYEGVAALTRQATEKRVRECATRLLAEYRGELSRSAEWVKFAGKLVSAGIDLEGASPRAMGLRSTERLAQASELTKEITSGLRDLAKRDFLSVTPKAEDLTLVYRWIRRYGVPHHYCQVFFDRAVMLSFESILDILANPELEGRDYFIETDEKNQGKVTFKINIQLGKDVLKDLKLPEHSSALKELPKGRLLFYVRFRSSQAIVLPEAFGDD